MQMQIKHLKESGLSIRKISHALSISRQTVRKYIHELGVSNPTEQNEPVTKECKGLWKKSIPWDEVVQQIKLKGTTTKQLHKEYAPEVSYWQFWRYLRSMIPSQPEVSIRRCHRPGERAEVDYCDGIPIIDVETGEIKKTQLFCGVLPFSSYTFGEFTWNQKLASFISSHEHMWQYFGGVVPYVVPDNLKSGVQKGHRYDPDVNSVYCSYAKHAGFAVLPARPYKPRDKAAVEAAIGVIQRNFFVQVRNDTFYNIVDLNRRFATYLEALNHTIMKDYGVSRYERFAAERDLLRPLPTERFEMHVWRKAKVHADCHIQLFRNFYSVPYNAVSTIVKVRLTSKMVEIFNESLEPLAAHVRLDGTGKFSTDERHYPDQKLGIKRFEVCKAEQTAKNIGPYTLEVVRKLIQIDYPLRYLRRIQGILRLLELKHVSVESLEYACNMALQYKKLRYDYIRSCAEHYQTNGSPLAHVHPPRISETLFLHNSTNQVGVVK